MAGPDDWCKDEAADTYALEGERDSGSDGPLTDAHAPPHRAPHHADLHAAAIAAIARRVVHEFDASLARAVARAMPRATGRLDGARLRHARVKATDKRAASDRVVARRPLRSFVAPLLAWTQSTESAAARSEALVASGLRTEVLYASVVEPCARALDEGARAERFAEADVTLGLLRLQTLVRCIGAASGAAQGFMPRTVALAAAPGESHALDAAIASECFRLAGWEVLELFGATDEAIAHLLRSRHVDAMVLTLGRAGARAGRIDALRRTVDTARSAANDPGFVVLMCGNWFAATGTAAREIGASAACTSAVDAPRTAAQLLID